MAKFKVMRQHYGDRLYIEGETREADASTVNELVKRGVLKAVAAPENKAEKPLRNKAAK